MRTGSTTHALRRPKLLTTALATVLASVLAAVLTAPASAVKETPAQAQLAAAPMNFTHPGVLVSRPQLDFVKAKVQAGAQPWKGAYDQMLGSKYASLTRTAKPRAIVECGSYSNPNNGCTDEREDAIAAYTLSLAWYISGDSRYATKSIEIMDAWSAVIKDHTNSNAPLQTGWAGSSWPRAAEIVKYTYSSWPNSGRFGTMLRNVYLPKVINGSHSNGNWELSMVEAAIGIAVFLEDRGAYDKAVTKFRGRVPAYIYVTSDGSLPKTAPGSGLDTRDEIIGYWQGQSTFMNGLSQETCRDLTHTGYGLSAISHIAETSRIQGQDLYPEVAERLRHALGLHAKYQLGEPVPGNLCNGSLKDKLGPITEVGFNALHNRMGIGMTNTQRLTEQQRPAGSNNLFVAWETLTHAGNTA
ncbi:alginate lyase family protein [Streptomyces lunaelactis]|uniref:alginate lyase family protein n=1 Tax=Streptomyces lunaelactis TaxID=1535768 RepID=UPI001585539F|nr:alginate lyase family protein [Streptomyces lunaelactis]NUK03284.1 alginate lyase family protein [Streptomyces lunaelactis]NUK07738.1 alginate lyase family protein [Streptomyces lunaelactis]NUK15840.1 alginate lyase family protein [Streptomyces lunaelactis]NUK23624.1 alginate lyase family protein [Streptomyces lunaelactis]NUK33869.1 alginate lyase family protein [Streptomyces lunaelactis]